jgi:protein-tyrosine phosphatase
MTIAAGGDRLTCSGVTVRWRRRYWPAFAVAVAALGVVAVYVFVDWYTRETPNYSQIEDGLYVGGFVSHPPSGATAVLNLCEAADPYHVDVHRWEPIHDGEPIPTLDWLGRQVEFIAAQRQAGNVVFVHCRNGVSRSGMVTAAYIIWRDGCSRDAALQYLRSSRQEVRPNPAFMRLLLEWQHEAVPAAASGSNGLSRLANRAGRACPRVRQSP